MNKLLVFLSLFPIIATAHDVNTFIETKVGYNGENEAITSFGTRVNLNFGNIKGFSEIAARDMKLNKKDIKLKDFTKFYSQYEIKEKLASKLEFHGKVTTNINKNGYNYTIDPDFKFIVTNNLKLNISPILAGNGKYIEKTKKSENEFKPELRLGFDYEKGAIKNYFDVAVKKELGDIYEFRGGVNYYIRNYKKNRPLRASKNTNRTILKDVELNKDSEATKYFYATYKLDNEFNYQKGKITFKNVTDVDYLNKDFKYYAQSIPNSKTESVFLSTPSKEEAIKIPYEHEIKRLDNNLKAVNKSEFKYKYNTNISLNLLSELRTNIKKTGNIKHDKFHYWYLDNETNEFSKQTYEQTNYVNVRTQVENYFKLEPQIHYSKTFSNKNSVTFTPNVAFETTYYNTKNINTLNITDSQDKSLQFEFINEINNNRKIKYAINPKFLAKYTANITDNLSLVLEPEIQLGFSSVKALDGYEKNKIAKMGLKGVDNLSFEDLNEEVKSNHNGRYAYFYDSKVLEKKYLNLVSNEESLEKLKENKEIITKINKKESDFKAFSYDGAKLKAKISLVYKW